MLEAYNKLFERYLRICKSKFDPENPYKNLEVCCDYSASFEYELLDMLNLMVEMNVITYEQNNLEWDRIVEAFSTHKLFNCYKEKDGTIMVWNERS